MLDLGIDLNVWPWLWLGVAVFIAVIELLFIPGSFVVLPFSVSAFAASIAGFYDASIELQWLIFVVLGAAVWMALYRFARRWVSDNDIAPGVGASRLVGLPAIVVRSIDPRDTERQGRVSVGGEVWGALAEGDLAIESGADVVITAVNGTRVVVRSSNTTESFRPPSRPPETGAP